MSSRLEGGCFCKAVRYRLTPGPMFVHCCHCLNCQSQTGSAFVLNAIIETDRIEVLSGEFEVYYKTSELWPAESLERLRAVSR